MEFVPRFEVSILKVLLNPKCFSPEANTCYLKYFCENKLDSVKSSNSSKTPPFCFATEFEENGSSGRCDVYPGRPDISGSFISLRMVQYTFKKCAETPSRGAIGCCSNIPDLKKDILYNLV